MTRSRHIPVRRCVGCGRSRPKPDLVRIIVDGDRGAVVDVESRLGGRGAYLCRDAACLERAMARNSLARALRRPLFPPGSGDVARREFLAALRGEVDGQARL